jgi:hypothetical protein
MIRTITLIGAASLFAVSFAAAQSSAPSSTAGGAQGTSKSGQMEQPATIPQDRKAPAATTTGSGAGMKGHNSPDATSGGAIDTKKGTPGSAR